MKIFIAGASGVLGTRLVRLLDERGDEVVGMTRTPSKAALLEELGARPVVADAFDRDAVFQAITDARPDIVVHQLTALSEIGAPRSIDRTFAVTNRLRTEGTDHLLAAGRAAGVRRFVAQSYAGWTYAPAAGRVVDEETPRVPDPPAPFRRLLEAIGHLERAVTAAPGTEGIVLRYGNFYGPGTSISVEPPGEHIDLVRGRRFPIVGRGSGVWSFIHIDDAAAATVAAIERARPGVYNVVDDEPAAISEWLPVLARTIDAPEPMRVPKWVGRLLAGSAAVIMLTEARGASNEKAKRELGWAPRYASWREGFRLGLGVSDVRGPRSVAAEGVRDRVPNAG